MKNFDEFIKYLQENHLIKKIFEESNVENSQEFGQAEMFMAFLSLLRIYHEWINAE